MSKPSTPGRRTSLEPIHKKATRSTSSDSSSSNESSTASSSAVRNTGAAYTTEEVKQKYLSRGTNDHSSDPPSTRSRGSSTGSIVNKEPPQQKPFQSRFLTNRTPPVTAPPPVQNVETETSSEEETDSEEESEEEPKDKREMAKTDIGPLLARSAQVRDTNTEARKTSKEEPSYATRSRYSTPREEPPPTNYRRRNTPVHEEESPSRYGYTSRFLNKSKSSGTVPPEDEDTPKYGSTTAADESESKYPTSRSRYMALKERRQRLARSKSSHTFPDDEDTEEPLSPTSANPSAYLASRGYGSSATSGNDLSRSRSSHALKSRENSPDRSTGGEKDGAALSSWARYLKNKYGNRNTGKDKDSSTAASPTSSTSAAARRLSLGLPLRSSTEVGSSDDDQKNMQGSPTTPTAATAAAGELSLITIIKEIL